MTLNLSGLDQFKASRLLMPEESIPAGAPLSVALDVIDFDPDQPRRTIDEAALKQLADSILAQGVLEPVALRPSAECVGRYVVNRGERRVRAARLAGLGTVPAFVDCKIDRYAQAVENLQREALSPFDLALFIREREQEGDSRAEIARRLQKPRSFITEIAGLVDAPDEVRKAFDAGRVSDLRVLYGLAREGRDEGAISNLLAGSGAITRQSLSAARQGDARRATLTPARGSRVVEGTQLAHALLVEHGGRRAKLGWSRPPGGQTADLQYEDGTRRRVALGDLKLIEWMAR